jgi:hypothetical protein
LLYPCQGTINAPIVCIYFLIQKKVKDYYSKIKDLIAGKIPKKELNPLTVDKEAAMRMIKAGIRTDPGQK